MPEKGKNDILEFKDYSKQLEAPYTIYADCEAVTPKVENSEKGIKQVHEISGWSLVVKSPYEEDQIMDYRGDHAGEMFLGNIQSLGDDLKKKIRDANAKMIFNKEDKEKFENAKQCHICEGLSLIHISEPTRRS